MRENKNNKVVDWTAKQHAKIHYKAINLFNIVLIVYFVLIHAYSKNVECMLFFSFFSIKDRPTQKGLTYMSLISLSWYSRYLVSSYVLSIELLSLARLCEVSSAVTMAAANSKKSWC